MTLKEFQIKLLRDPVLGKLIPMGSKRTFPRFQLTDGKLYASFLGVQAKPVPEGLQIKEPVYYLRLQYPQCRLSRYVRFEGEKAVHLMTGQEPELISRTLSLCDAILQQYDRQAPELAQTIDEYNAIVNRVLETHQVAVLDKMEAL